MTRESLHNRPTRYELIAQSGEARVLIMYCVRTGRHTILESIRKHGPALLTLVAARSDDVFSWCKPASAGAMLADWNIRFSGRTQRDCIGSELPWIGDEAFPIDPKFAQ